MCLFRFGARPAQLAACGVLALGLLGAAPSRAQDATPAVDLSVKATDTLAPAAPEDAAPGPAAPGAIAPAAGSAPAEGDAGSLQLTGASRATALRFSGYVVDPGGSRSDDAPLGASRLTLRADFDTGRRLGPWSAQLALAVDFWSGTFAGAPTAMGDKLPNSRWDNVLPTQAWASIGLRDLGSLRVGLMASQWGLGLVANDGQHALDSRSESWFLLPESVDRVARAQVILQPFGRSTGQLRGLFIAASADQVIEDAIAVRADGDNAWQQVLAVRWHAAKERWAGVYYVHRGQNFRNDAGPFLRVQVLDGAVNLDWREADRGLLLQAECAAIFGTTSLSPSPDHPEHDIQQGAAVVRARWQAGELGLRGELDAGYFSGDDNIDDGTLTAFKTNPNFQQGILLFSQVLGWQTGRARLTASNPQLAGYPAEDLDRLASGGAVTSAITVFPKVGYKAASFLEVYGGALLAFAPTTMVDPFSTRAVGGGAPRNFLGKAPDGAQLGTELDLGLVATFGPAAWPVAVAVRGEYAVLLPGGALAGLEADGPIHGGRLSLSVLPHFGTKGAR